MQKTTTQILIGARKRIEDSEHWIKHSTAKKYDKNGNLINCDATDSDACAWDPAGAVEAEIPAGQYLNYLPHYLQAVILLDQHCLKGSVRIFNNRPATTHKDILNIFDKAIERAKQLKKVD